jgi:hypothetical protein
MTAAAESAVIIPQDCRIMIPPRVAGDCAQRIGDPLTEHFVFPWIRIW